MSKKRVVTTQAYMRKARAAIEREDDIANAIYIMGIALNKILSDGQMQQLDRVLAQLEGSLK